MRRQPRVAPLSNKKEQEGQAVQKAVPQESAGGKKQAGATLISSAATTFTEARRIRMPAAFQLRRRHGDAKEEARKRVEAGSRSDTTGGAACARRVRRA